MKWVVPATAPDQLEAEMWVMVAEGELEHAKEIMEARLGDGYGV